jgi:alkylated DNA repair protein alkB homolog 1
VENFEDIQALAKPAAPSSSSLTPLPLSSIIHKLRWSNIGHFYHWGTKSYQFDRQQVPIPPDIKTVCQRAVRAVPWEDIWRDGVDVAAGEWELPNPDYNQWHETYSQWQYKMAQILVF